ncbi:MAG: DUF445 domain-containing protein [Bacillota bacterium]
MQLIVMMLIGGFIGYLTNKIAVKMLFRPIKPRKIIFFTFQGLLPKRKSTIALSMGKTIEDAFISQEDITDTLINDVMKDEFKTVLKQELIVKIDTLIPPMFKSMLGDNVKTMIEDFIQDEGDDLIETLMHTIQEKGIKNIDIQALVKKRIDDLDFIEFEKLVMDIVRKELRHIELVGLFLGLIIGAIQFGIIQVL